MWQRCPDVGRGEMPELWLWIRVKMTTIAAARAALKVHGMQLHDEARVEPDKARRSHLRAEGDHYVAEERELQKAEQRSGETPGE